MMTPEEQEIAWLTAERDEYRKVLQMLVDAGAYGPPVHLMSLLKDCCLEAAAVLEKYK